MGARRNFVGGGGGQAQKRSPIKTQKAPDMEKKVAKRPPHDGKGPHEEKTWQKRPPRREKVAKRLPI